MSVHRRQGKNSAQKAVKSDEPSHDTAFRHDDPSPDDHNAKDGGKTSRRRTRQRHYGIALIVTCQLCFIAFAMYKTKSIKSVHHATSIAIAAWVFSLPIFMLIAVGSGITSKVQHPHEAFIPLAMVATVLGTNLPPMLTTACSSLALFIFGLSSRPINDHLNSDSMLKSMQPQHNSRNGNTVSSISRSNQPTWMASNGPMPTLYAILAMIATLLVENFCVWVVSASYTPSHDKNGRLPDPLQDNGQLAMRYIFKSVLDISKTNVVRIRNMVNVQWALVSGVALCLVTVVLYGSTMRKNLWHFVRRIVLTLAAARFLRTVSFLITVLPSQNQHCYFGKFPNPPPEDWKSWLLQGMVPYSSGGCNDLIISGHATVTATMACVVVATVKKPTFTLATWMLVTMDYMVEVYEGFHYSVDMWLGCVIVNFTWNLFSPIEEEGVSVLQDVTKNDSGSGFKPIHQFTTKEAFLYALPPVGSFLQVSKILPREFGNFTIIIFVVAAVVEIARSGFNQYARHIMFCVLYTSLGVYL